MSAAGMAYPEPRECRECGCEMWSIADAPICDGCEMHARGYEAGRRGALTGASVADLVAELGRRTEGAMPTEAEVARLVAGQEERLRVLEAYTAGLAALVRDAAELLAGATVHEVGETHTWASVRRAVVLGHHVYAADVQQWAARARALGNANTNSRRTG